VRWRTGAINPKTPAAKKRWGFFFGGTQKGRWRTEGLRTGGNSGGVREAEGIRGACCPTPPSAAPPFAPQKEVIGAPARRAWRAWRSRGLRRLFLLP